MSFAAEVVTDSSGKFAGNGLRFETKEEAEEYAYDLFMRWTLVITTRVVESSDPVNYMFINGRLEDIATGQETA
jgi:hypothetical protein